MRHGLFCAVVLLLLIGSGSTLSAQVADQPPITDQQVDAAVSRGVAYLWSLQQDDGSFKGHDVYLGIDYAGSSTVMSMLALIYAGENPAKPEMKKGLEALRRLDLQKVYTLGFRIIALAELYQRSGGEVREELRGRIREDVAQLLQWQLARGGWIYEKPKGQTWDFSNTQLALLALREAVRCGIEPKRDVFQKVQQLYLERQQKDGGWNYGRPPGGGKEDSGVSYGAMTAAGVASLFLTREMLEPCAFRQPHLQSAG